MSPPPHPPHHGPPHPHGDRSDAINDEDVLRFAPPEIRRVWKRLVDVERQVKEVLESVRRIEEALKARGGG